jgi:chromosome segregation ATPase
MTANFLTSPFVIGVSGFLLGWLLSTVSARVSERSRVRERDPRDIRIRSLEAEHRVAETNAARFKSEAERLVDEVRELAEQLEQNQKVVAEQQAKVVQLRSDLTGSVRKTRELRAELAERATENVHAEAKIREVETELSIVQASTDLISTGVLSYFDDSEDEDRTAVL